MNSNRKILVAACCSILCFTACDEDSSKTRGPDGATSGNTSVNPTGDGTAANMGTSAAGDKVRQGLPIAYALPRYVATNIYMSRAMVVEAVYYATAASGSGQLGQVTSTGTISVSQAGAEYLATPTDRLIVKLGPQTHEFVVKQAQGNNQSETAAGWLLAPHTLQYTHRLPDQAEADITVQFDGQRFDVKATGWATLSGQRYDVELAAAGGMQGTRDFQGQEGQTQYDLTGTVRGNGYDIDISEHHAVSMAASTSLQLLTTQRGSASQFNGTINNTLKFDGETFKFENVQVQTNSKDKGGTSQSGVVALSGAILRNNQPFATCGLQNGMAFAQTGNETIPLDAGAAPQ